MKSDFKSPIPQLAYIRRTYSLLKIIDTSKNNFRSAYNYTKGVIS